MGAAVSEADLQALLEVAALEPGEDAPGGLPYSMLERAQRLIPCDCVSFTDFNVRTGENHADQDLPEITVAHPDDGAFLRHYWDCLPCSYPSRSGDEYSVTMFSDFYTLTQLRSTGMYREYFAPIGFEREIMMCLPTPGERTRRLIFFRGRGSNFSERDRLLLSLLRPHLTEAYQRLEQARRAVPDLTSRQWQLLRLVAAGHTNAEIAQVLFVSPLTVRKHLENIFERLGVTTRTAAVSTAFPGGA